MRDPFDALQKTLTDKTPKDPHWKSAVHPDHNNVGYQARVDFGGANQPKGLEERNRTC